MYTYELKSALCQYHLLLKVYLYYLKTKHYNCDKWQKYFSITEDGSISGALQPHDVSQLLLFTVLVSAYFVALCWSFNRLSVTSGRSAIQYINMEYCGRDKVAQDLAKKLNRLIFIQDIKIFIR